MIRYIVITTMVLSSLMHSMDQKKSIQVTTNEEGDVYIDFRDTAPIPHRPIIVRDIGRLKMLNEQDANTRYYVFKDQESNYNQTTYHLINLFIGRTHAAYRTVVSTYNDLAEMAHLPDLK